MSKAIKETHFSFPGQKDFYKGKVRDVYMFDKELVVVASDRISAFDVVLPRAIPYKGQVLNQIAAGFLKATSDLVPNWVTATPDPSVTIGKRCEPFKVEMVIRGYLAGHAAREYALGKRMLCGVTMPEGLKENDAFPTPMIILTSKAFYSAGDIHQGISFGFQFHDSRSNHRIIGCNILKINPCSAEEVEEFGFVKLFHLQFFSTHCPLG